MKEFATSMIMALTTYKIVSLLVGFGAIFIGYRLFALGIYEKAGNLEATFGKKHLVLKQAAPGTFFVVLGSIIIIVALWKGLAFEPVNRPDDWVIGRGMSDQIQRNDRQYSPTLMRREIAILNAIPGSLSSELPAHQQEDIKTGIQRIKLALMELVWSSEWGDRNEFKRLVQQSEIEQIPAEKEKAFEEAFEYYRYIEGGTFR